METKKKEQNTKAEAETFAATVKGMNRDDQLMLNGFCWASAQQRRCPASPNRQAESPGGRSAMKITHVFPDGTRTPDIDGLRVPYTAQTAAAYQAVAAAQHHKKEEHTDED